MALGYINPESAILVRVLSREDVNVDEEFIRSRLERAVAFRKELFGIEGSVGEQPGGYRLVYSEADFLPGLVVDIFGCYLSFQTLTLGIDRWKETIVEALSEIVEPKGIYERNDAPVRSLEGLPQKAGYIGQPFDPLVEMDENGFACWSTSKKGRRPATFSIKATTGCACARYQEAKKCLTRFPTRAGSGFPQLMRG